MYYLPLTLLAVSTLGFLFRPGFFLGVVFQAYQYESVYSMGFAGSASLLLFVVFTVVIAIFARVKIVWLLPEKLLGLFTILYCIAAFYSPDPSKGLELAARFIHLEESSHRLEDLDKELKMKFFRLKHELTDRSMREIFASRIIHTRR